MSWNFDVGSVVHTIGDKVWNWTGTLWQFGYDYRDHWLLGPVVEHVTDPMTGHLVGIANGIDTVEGRVDSVKEALEDVHWGGYFEWHLDNFIDDFQDFWHHPSRWVVNNVSDILPGFDLFCLDPGYHIKTWLCGRWPWLGDLFDNPSRWVVNKISDVVPGFDLLCLDPGDYIRRQIYLRYPSLDGLFEGPVHWVTERFLDRYPVWRTAFEQPGDWFLDSLAWAFDCEVAELHEVWTEITEFVDHPGEYIAEVLVEFLGDILENWITTYWERELPGR